MYNVSFQKIYQDVPVFPRDYPLMGLYPEGVPCHSTAMPRHLRSIKDIGGRESETIVSPCLEACPTEPPMRKSKCFVEVFLTLLQTERQT